MISFMAVLQHSVPSLLVSRDLCCSSSSSSSSILAHSSHLLVLPKTWKKKNLAFRRGRVWEGEGNAELEDEIFDFMEKSGNPRDFPTKERLIASGRMDLVQMIADHGGWMTLGWDFENPVSDERDRSPSRNYELNGMNDGGDSASLTFSDFTIPYSSADSAEIDGGEGSGIEGILRRLEEERSATYLCPRTERMRSSADAGSIGNSSGLETWRAWSNRRAGYKLAEFEAEEIAPNGSRKAVIREKKSVSNVDTESHDSWEAISDSMEEGNEQEITDKERGHDQIRSSIRNLELELNSVLRSIRSKPETTHSLKEGNSTEEFDKLSDDWEFQETEIMRAQEKLRAIRAKLAILEGKFSIETMEAQKLVQQKQGRIDQAKKVLYILRSTCIVWSNSASVVLLVGSFDGWANQRVMKRSSTGIFSLNLKLYPGRYEIKFIVDGVWMIDPLRPTVYNNGHENNLLIVS